MDAPSGLMLFGAGLVGGIVTAVVGGASLITFPALLAATRLPAIVANASNAVAPMPGNVGGGIADPERLPRGDRPLVGLIAVCVTGRVAGAGFLQVTPERAGTFVVPLRVFDVQCGSIAWPGASAPFIHS